MGRSNDRIVFHALDVDIDLQPKALVISRVPEVHLCVHLRPIADLFLPYTRGGELDCTEETSCMRSPVSVSGGDGSGKG